MQHANFLQTAEDRILNTILSYTDSNDSETIFILRQQGKQCKKHLIELY